MVKTRKYVLIKHFQGPPKRDDFDIIEEELPPLKTGEFLVKAEWISVDPYQRAYNTRTPTPFDQFSFQVGIVTETMNPDYPFGTRVVSQKGWREYSIIDPEIDGKDIFSMYYELPDLKGLPLSLGVGAVGMPGATAYFGFLEICRPKPGETVVVTSAAGAIGSLVGQIAKIKGCKVIGFTGSDKKAKWLESIGFDKAFNYKTADVPTALDEAAPKGVDCFFDNAGGEISAVILSKMNLFGRVSVCGCISSYNDSSPLTKPNLPEPLILFKQLKVEGFIVDRWLSQWSEAFDQLVEWIQSGQIKASEHITEGFDNIYDAFEGMLNGNNSGKAVVKI